jgi:hypothetical protein
MSALGQKRTYAVQQAMSALHPIATLISFVGMAALGQSGLAELDFSSKCISEKDGNPTLQRHPDAPTVSLRQKSTFAQPINHCRRRKAIPEQCEISQTTQIAPLQIALHP